MDRTDALLATPITPYTRVEGFHRFAIAHEGGQLVQLTPAVGMTAAEFDAALKKRALAVRARTGRTLTRRRNRVG